jgi:hypothetical protein
MKEDVLMKKNAQISSITAVVFITIIFLGLFIGKSNADGKLLRGEKWKRFSVEGEQADFYVAPNGNDSWSGRLASPNSNKTDGPFATIERAQKAVRELKKQVYKPKKPPVEKRWIGSPHPFGKGKDILVLIRDGYYSLEEPLEFTEEDGGERIETYLPSGAFEYHKLKDHYVTYAAFPGEMPIISGGKKINHWTQKNGIWSTHVDGVDVRYLVLDGKMQTLARTPNKGFFTPPVFSRTDQELSFRDGEIRQWPDMEDNRVIMLLRWHTGINSIERVDEKEGVAYLKEAQNGILIVPPRYYVENVKSLLDAPGEWFFDNNSDELSLIPPEHIADPNNVHTIASVLEQIIVIKGDEDKPVRNLRFYGLNFEATVAGKEAISMEYAHNCELVDSQFRSMGGTAIRLNIGCYQNKILSNKFKTINNGVIIVSGDAHPENWMDIIRETSISYNSIDDCGGINIVAQNTLFTTISRNEITNTHGRYAISVGGWRNLEEAIDGGYRVEYNHLHQVQRKADDSGVIKTAGMTYDSYVRRNLIHDVKAGYFNDNVGFWFDNMSSGWVSEENIFYNLEQGEMKLCAANLTDNIYRNNYTIEPPENAPEGVIEGDPKFEYSNLKIELLYRKDSEIPETGEFIKVTAEVKNTGSTGILPVDLYLDGKVLETKPFPVTRNNSRVIQFDLRCNKPGEHKVAIGTTPYKSFTIAGDVLTVTYSDMNLSDRIFPSGANITVDALVHNLIDREQNVDVILYLNDTVYETKSTQLDANEVKGVSFVIAPEAGQHIIKVGNYPAQKIEVYPSRKINITNTVLAQYCSGTAQQCDFKVDQTSNKYRLEAAGSDFFHAEDSYGALYIQEKIKGNFVATVKVNRFGTRTHEWFRAGLFARNDLAKSFDTEPGSLGSVLLFATPGRAGIQWDEFADGCMHKASSQNLPEDISFPLWLRLERKGDTFSGYISFDGKTWTRNKRTGPVPGLAHAIHIGLAAGSCDQIPYWVEFENLEVEVEDKK